METKNVTITPEYLEKIKRFVAIRPDETFSYVPTAFKDLPDEIKPRFTLRPISGEDALTFSDSMRSEVSVEAGGRANVKISRGSFTINVVKRGLVRWDNFYDINGRIVDYSPAAFENLSIKLLEELSEVIINRASLTEEEVLGLG